MRSIPLFAILTFAGCSANAAEMATPSAKTMCGSSHHVIFGKKVAQYGVLCCCRTAGGGECCAQTSYCSGSFVPGCLCSLYHGAKEVRQQ